MDSILGNRGEHLVIFFSGASVFGVVAHAVQTFPVPQNKYGQWVLSVVQYAVCQRERAANTMLGASTVTTAKQ